MKSHLLPLLFLMPLLASVHAQTYLTVSIPTNATSIAIPSNTMLTIVNGQFRNSVDFIFNGQTNNMFGYYQTLPPSFALKFVGPGSLQFSAYPGGDQNGFALLKFEAVNTTPALSGYGVQPNGKTAAVSLETSTDLKTWQTTTNGIYPATNAAAFFRLNFQVN